MAKIDCDCSGWATKANLKCGDGQTIMPGAFKDCDGMTVPVCWGHIHDDPMRVLGRALLEHKDDGTYAYIDFNNTEQGRNASPCHLAGAFSFCRMGGHYVKENTYV